MEGMLYFDLCGGVVICSVETRSLLWATGSSVVFLFTFNFLFSDPKFTFRIDDANYAISLAIFIIVAFIVASLTMKLQRQMDIANLRADITARLNEIGSGFLNISGIPALVEYSRKSLEKLTGKQVVILIRDRKTVILRTARRNGATKTLWSAVMESPSLRKQATCTSPSATAQGLMVALYSAVWTGTWKRRSGSM